MLYRIFGNGFGLLMALHYYVLLVLIPAMIESYLGGDG